MNCIPERELLTKNPLLNLLFSKHVLLCYKTKSLLQGIRVLKQATTYLDCIEESCCSQSKLKPQNSCLKWLLDTLFQDKMHCPFTRKSIHLMRDFESKELNCFTTREYTYTLFYRPLGLVGIPILL